MASLSRTLSSSSTLEAVDEQQTQQLTTQQLDVAPLVSDISGLLDTEDITNDITNDITKYAQPKFTIRYKKAQRNTSNKDIEQWKANYDAVNDTPPPNTYECTHDDILTGKIIIDIKHDMFYEDLQFLRYRCPYFDFDVKITLVIGKITLSQWNEFYELLLTLCDKFGKFSIVGYGDDVAFIIDFTTNLEVQDLDDAGWHIIQHKPNTGKYLSLHIVFYETYVDWLHFRPYMLGIVEKCKFLQYESKIKIGDKIKEKPAYAVDDSVYKPFGDAQLLRNMASSKNEEDKAVTLSPEQIAQQMVTPSPTAKFITNEEVDEFMKKINIKAVTDKKKDIKVTKSVTKDFKPEYAEFGYDNPLPRNQLIELNKHDLMELLNDIDDEPTFNVMEKVAGCIAHSPYDKEFLLNVLTDWYTQAAHEHPDSVNKYINSYYEQEFTNKWFYSLIKHIKDVQVQTAWKNRFKHYAFDESITFNDTDELHYDKFTSQEYIFKDGRPDIIRFVNDLKRVMAYIINHTDRQHYIIKKYNRDGDSFTYDDMKLQDIETYFRKKTLGEYTKETKKGTKKTIKITWLQVFNAYHKQIEYNDGLFIVDNNKYKNSNDKLFQLFSGYPYKGYNKCNTEYIADFLTLNKTVMGYNEEIINYMRKWWAYILKYPDKMAGVATLITGDGGTGKSMWGALHAKLLGKYCKSVNDLNNVTGHFNAQLQNARLILCNEADGKAGQLRNNINFENLKSIITDPYVEITEKGKDSRTTRNYANFIMLTNNNDVINLEKTQDKRRFLVVQPSNKLQGNTDFFERFEQHLNDSEFMRQVMTWYMTADISNFNPHKDKPVNDASNDVLLSGGSTGVQFIRDEINKFIIGYEFNDAWKDYNTWFTDTGKETGKLEKDKLQDCFKLYCKLERADKRADGTYRMRLMRRNKKPICILTDDAKNGIFKRVIEDYENMQVENENAESFLDEEEYKDAF